MKIEMTGGNSFGFIMSNGYEFEYGRVNHNEGFFVKGQGIEFTIQTDRNTRNVFDGLVELFIQMYLEALPVNRNDYDHKRLYEAVETALRNLGMQPYLHDWADEDEDCVALSSAACFADGLYEQRVRVKSGLVIATLKKCHHRKRLEIRMEYCDQNGNTTQVITKYIDGASRVNVPPITYNALLSYV